MVDHIKALGYKVTVPKIGIFVFTALLFFWIAPIDQINLLRQMDFESLTFGFWFVLVGLLFFVEGLLSLPETRKATSKAGASILIGLGFIAFAFGALSLIAGVDIVKGSTELSTISSIILGGASILLFVALIPEIFNRKSWVVQLAKGL